MKRLTNLIIRSFAMKSEQQAEMLSSRRKSASRQMVAERGNSYNGSSYLLDGATPPVSGASRRNSRNKVYIEEISKQISTPRRNSKGVTDDTTRPITSSRRNSRGGIFDDTMIMFNSNGELNMFCCNMKLSDLKDSSKASKAYNIFELALIQQQKVNIQKYKGRSISSIRKNPSEGIFDWLKKPTNMTIITDNILLGGGAEAENLALLNEYGVTHILNTAQQIPNHFPQNFVYLKLPLLDNMNSDIAGIKSSVISFLSHVENIQGRVFVHCLAGVSRSVAVLLMHMVAYHHISLRDAYQYIQSCRFQMNPNEAFRLQLAKLEVQELGYSSVSKLEGDKTWNFYAWNDIKRTFPTSPPLRRSSTGNNAVSSNSSSGITRQTSSSGGGGRDNSEEEDNVSVCCTIS